MLLGAVAAIALVAAWAAPGGTTRPAQTSSKGVIVFNGEGNNLNAYAADPPFTKQNVIRNHDDDPKGLDINAQICFFPDGSKRFIAGEDTGQPNPPQGWGIFQLRSKVGKLGQKVGKLTPTYASNDNARTAGAVPVDGRVLMTDIGNRVGSRTDSSSCGSRRSTLPRSVIARSMSASPRRGHLRRLEEPYVPSLFADRRGGAVQRALPTRHG
jgi:hypothetical protein